MIKLSRFADYAVVILSELGRDGAAMRLSAAELSARVRLPEPTVAKILKSLTRAGLLTSTRGVHGGYGLSRPAESISVAAIITAIDGPIAITDCADDKSCMMEGYCAMHGRWGKVNMAIRAALDSLTLRDLATPSFKPLPQPLDRVPRRSADMGEEEAR